MKSLFFLITFWWCVSTLAQNRSLDLEFEPVPGAVRYDFEFRLQDKTEVFRKLSQKEPNLEITLPFNHYEFRQRTLDRRKVAGPWSNWEKLSVTIPEIKITAPLLQEKIETKEAKDAAVKISWSGAEGIKEFEVKVIDVKTQKLINSVTTTKKFIEMKVPVAAEYEVQVRTTFPENSIPKDLAVTVQSRFFVIGKELDRPLIKRLTSPHAQKIFWEKNELSETSSVSVQKFSYERKKWQPVYKNKALVGDHLDFEPNWGAGKYLIQVAANAALHKSSPAQREKFELASVRTPAAEYNSMLLKSIDRVNGYFTQISWLTTQMDLSSTNFETSTNAHAKPLGGTVRAGIGYFQREKPFGLMAFVNTSRMILNDNSRDFASLDLNAVYRYKFLVRDELRLAAGVGIKQIPVLIGDTKVANFEVQNAMVKGPRFGFEYWFSLGPFWGLQANYNQNFYNLLDNNSAPNGNKLKLTNSFQAGLQMSYQFTTNVTGLVGLTHQEEKYEYEANAVNLSVGPNTNTNNGYLKADYVGLMVEIGL